MSKLLFSEEEIQKLDKNKYVLRVSHKAITYTDEFKLHFITEYNNGKQTRMIFEEAGLSVDLIGNARVKSAAKRWRIGYLSTVKDGSTNEILAYHLSERITLDIATTTIEKLAHNKRIKLSRDAFIHSDQGVHYTSPRF